MSSTEKRLLFLSFTPVDMSLTAGTSIPAPPASPPQSPGGLGARPPTPGGGPLSSHPTTPIEKSRWSPPTSTRPSLNTPPISVTDSPTLSSKKIQTDYFRPPLSPASANTQRRNSTGVRKLLSLSSLRNSFSSSRTSLALSTQQSNTSHPSEPITHGIKRPSSPSIISSAPSQQPPQLRKRKSGSWFRRKSAMFMVDEDGMLDSVEESKQSRPATALPQMTGPPAPRLPDVGTLRGGRLTGGTLAGDDIFASIGR